MTMHYTGALLGRNAVIEFPESTAYVSYSVRGELKWKVTDKHGNVTQGQERLSYLQLSDKLHFLNWVEKQVLPSARSLIQRPAPSRPSGPTQMK